MDGDRRAVLGRLARWLAASLVVVAAGMLLVTVEVHANGRSASCGSAWDVVAGRAGWRQWWAQDQAEPVPGSRLLRTSDCVGAVNAHIVAAAAILLVACAAFAAGALATRRIRPGVATSGPARRLRVLGTAAMVIGSALSLAGVVGIALLTADPEAPLFLYVSRTTVVLLGLVLLVPAVLLVVLGSGAGAVAEALDHERPPREQA